MMQKKQIGYGMIMMIGLSGCAMAPPTQVGVTQQCQPEAAQTLVGQKDLSTSQIQQITHAEIVRMVAPNQPVTMDYRANRITVLVDPETKTILTAHCG